MLKLQREEEKIVREYIDSIRKYFPGIIDEIILFGSKSRGDSHQESDIDLLIVINTDDRQIKRKILDLSWDAMLNNNFKIFISPIIFFKKEYEQYQKWHSSFLHNVAKEGVRL